MRINNYRITKLPQRSYAVPMHGIKVSELHCSTEHTHHVPMRRGQWGYDFRVDERVPVAHNQFILEADLVNAECTLPNEASYEFGPLHEDSDVTILQTFPDRECIFAREFSVQLFNKTTYRIGAEGPGCLFETAAHLEEPVRGRQFFRLHEYETVYYFAAEGFVTAITARACGELPLLRAPEPKEVAGHINSWLNDYDAEHKHRLARAWSALQELGVEAEMKIFKNQFPHFRT